MLEEDCNCRYFIFVFYIRPVYLLLVENLANEKRKKKDQFFNWNF